METFDYIVIGAGSAGCALSARLAQAGKQVLLLEAGPADNHPYVHIPGTFIRVHGTRRTWMYRTEPEPHVNQREVFIPQGRTLGGGSSVNAMIYIRGQAEDYEEWKNAGCQGWGWSDVLPVFRRCEANARLGGQLHGQQGPLKVSDPRHKHFLSRAFVTAAVEAGVPATDDFNGARQEGAGFYQTTTADGRRASSAVSYLRPLRKNPNLKVMTGIHVSRLQFDGLRVVGVQAQDEAGRGLSFRARGEVIVSAGAIASPKLLMLSGIGPREHLQAMGIDVRVDAPEVGENFQDHLSASVYAQTRQPSSLLGHDRGLRAIGHGLKYLATRHGLLSSNVVESGAFVDATGCGRPDVQFHVVPALVGDIDRMPPAGHGISVNPCALRPRSRGRLRLKSADPLAQVALNANYLSDPEDMRTLVAGVKLARKILRAPALANVVERMLMLPESDDVPDTVFEDYVRTVAKTVFHPAGTCRMGSDAAAVVDPTLRVRGVQGLRVADASIMPTIVSGNTNAPCIMIGERCADFILSAQA
ncbi:MULTISPECIES: GMC family oxidoreductase [Pseudomonas]|jgi:choline dehydrogenase-like flavoprotein|uniref:GMC family oxidoreductase n=1 Tax=Pseudomonas TaxID=286 RepID=UPI00047FDC52|nr:MULTISPECIES: FAD-dependent oxidoreductase [Pseudomonas]PRA53696.1 GMC family oxidoreductase [Pseudomonas sp. MYb115]QXN48106.1 GMC family oxidoreductase N-terminal domain-containing protein [Pseudomonas fluorescens]WSO22416.1 FAD-dependent oxidoreductase [Pseudomonas fluorescens]